jgi:hypothetical protein
VSTEVVTIEETPLEPPPDVTVSDAPKDPPKPKTKPKAKDESAPAEPSGGGIRSKIFARLKESEHIALRDIYEGLGGGGGFKIAVHRIEPQEYRDPSTNRIVKVGGFLRSYEDAIDEEKIREHWGGGTFDLRFTARDDDGRSRFVTSKRIHIAGDPRTDAVYRESPSAVAATAAAPTPEAPSVVTKAMDMMAKQMEVAQQDARDARQQAVPRDDSAAVETARTMAAMFEKQLAAAQDQIRAMAAEMTTLRNTKPPEDPIKDKLLGSLIDGESGRITGLRMQHESELRQMKELHIADLKRLEDRADRDRQSLQSSFDRERQSLVQSHELAMTSVSASKDMQIKVLEGQIRSLERECDGKTKEIAELRSKKDKSVVEMAKDLQAVKDALGSDEDEKSGGFADKIGDLITNPEGLQAAGAAISHIFRGNKAATGTPAQAQQAKPPPQYKKQVVKGPDGNIYQVQPTGHLVPFRKKTKEEGLDLPQIAPEHVTIAVNLLQNAFDRGADPVEVASGNKALVPQDIIVAIRDHGIDVFMTKIAKIPPNSSLSSQEARNWLRKLAAALVG